MRRLAFVAVLGSLVLTACSDLSKEAPTEPDGVSQPSFIVLKSEACAELAWLNTQLALAKTIFPGGKGKTLLSSANEKLTDIYNLCTKNQQTAIAKAMFFDDWMFKRFQSNLLTTSPTLSTDLRILFVNVLNGVGLNTSTISPVVTSDAGTGVFLCAPTCPTTPTTVFTRLSLAALQIPGQGFSETTLLIIDKLPNDTKLEIPAGQGRSQLPPFYEFNAINASDQHVLNTGKYAHVEMCLYQDVAYPPDIAIGHNPVFGAPGYPFEVLPSDNISLLGCEFDGSKIVSANHGSLPGLAVSAWHTTKQALAAILLPQALRAATMALRRGSAAGKTSSLSPFGIVGSDIPATFGSAGWSYKQIGNLEKVPVEWLTITPTAADGWSTGTAPFGTGCALTTRATPWDQNTTMLLRRDIFIPANTASITIDILIDNSVFAFVNGWGVDHGGFVGSGCEPVQFTVNASSTGKATDEAPLLPGQVNQIFIRGVDTDEKTQPYLDAKITLNQVSSRTAP
jgi:hypothetical protein